MAIEINGVTFAYPGSREPAVQDVTLRVGFGERLGILGPNGGGKTTLIKLVLGLLSPSNGRIEVCGLTPTEARTRGLIGYVPQRSEAELAFPLSARQVVAMGVGKALGTRHWALGTGKGKGKGIRKASGIRHRASGKMKSTGERGPSASAGSFSVQRAVVFPRGNRVAGQFEWLGRSGNREQKCGDRGSSGATDSIVRRYWRLRNAVYGSCGPVWLAIWKRAKPMVEWPRTERMAACGGAF
ncbi:MAG: ATP-binding cassette domain-containing protein [Proteobacteria bacterium]|nr:ATP-binding cassette domain-containing protein [Pseudomonadota bacterium]